MSRLPFLTVQSGSRRAIPSSLERLRATRIASPALALWLIQACAEEATADISVNNIFLAMFGVN